MKAEINEAILVITPENNTENYALDQWFKNHQDGCSYIMKPLDLRTDICQQPFRPKKIKPPELPLARIIVAGAIFTAGICPNCHSTVFRKHYLFGKKYCINDKCVFNTTPITI